MENPEFPDKNLSFIPVATGYGQLPNHLDQILQSNSRLFLAKLKTKMLIGLLL